jgi:hypothetical protein
LAGNPAARRALAVQAATLLLPARYALFKACAMSAIRSDGCSMPIDSRIVESRTPIFWRMSAGTPEWVMLAGRLASDSVPPRLTASLKICSEFHRRADAEVFSRVLRPMWSVRGT